MAKISTLPPATALTGDETMPVVQDAQMRRATLAQVVEQAADPYVAAARAAAALAEALAGPTFPTVTAGLAATIDTMGFAVLNGDGTRTTYVNVGGNAVLLTPLATTAALAAAAGADLVGYGNGTVADVLDGLASFGGQITPQGVDMAAVQAAFDLANSNIGAGQWVTFDSRKTYVLADSIRVGTALANSNVKGIDFRHAEIVPALNGKPVFDLIGIRNQKFLVRNLFINSQGTNFIPDCIFALGRPKHPDWTPADKKVYSSGNVVFDGNVIFANCSVGIVRNASSEANDLNASNIFFNYHPIGICVALTKSDYFRDTLWLEFDGQAGAAFAPGQTLTGAGGGTAKILHTVQDWGGGAGGCLVWVTAGTFVDNEALTSSGGGTANVNLPLGVRLNGPLTHFGNIEVETTAARQDIKAYCNAALRIAGVGRAGMPPIFISDFTDVNVSGSNQNVNNGKLAFVHVQQDMTRFPANSQPPVGFRSYDNYFHSDHLWSVTIGDPAGPAGAELENIILGPERNAGQATVMQGRYKYIGAAGYRMRAVRVVSDHMVDFRGVELKHGNIIELIDPVYSGLKLDTLSNANVRAPSGCAARIELTMADSGNFVSIFYTDLNMEAKPPRGVTRTIVAGAITADRPNFRVQTEGLAASSPLTKINLPAGVRASGIELTFGSTDNTRSVVVTPSANIIVPAAITLNNTAKSVTVIGESGAGDTAVFRVKSAIV